MESTVDRRSTERIVQRIWNAVAEQVDESGWRELLSDVAYWSVGKTRGDLAYARGALGTASQSLEGPVRTAVDTGVAIFGALESAARRDENEKAEAEVIGTVAERVAFALLGSEEARPKDLAVAVGADRYQVSKALRKLLASGEVVEVAESRGGASASDGRARLYRLADPPARAVALVVGSRDDPLGVPIVKDDGGTTHHLLPRYFETANRFVGVEAESDETEVAVGILRDAFRRVEDEGMSVKVAPLVQDRLGDIRILAPLTAVVGFGAVGSVVGASVGSLGALAGVAAATPTATGKVPVREKGGEAKVAKTERTGRKAAASAARTLSSRSASKDGKSATGSALAQSKTTKTTKATGKKAASAAGKTLRSATAPKRGKSATGSALTQRTSKKRK